MRFRYKLRWFEKSYKSMINLWLWKSSPKVLSNTYLWKMKLNYYKIFGPYLPWLSLLSVLVVSIRIVRSSPARWPSRHFQLKESWCVCILLTVTMISKGRWYICCTAYWVVGKYYSTFRDIKVLSSIWDLPIRLLEGLHSYAITQSA